MQWTENDGIYTTHETRGDEVIRVDTTAVPGGWRIRFDGIDDPNDLLNPKLKTFAAARGAVEQIVRAKIGGRRRAPASWGPKLKR